MSQQLKLRENLEGVSITIACFNKVVFHMPYKSMQYLEDRVFKDLKL